MSAVEKRTVTTTRHEYAVPNPASRGDITDAIRQAQHDMPESRRGWDDSCTIEARGEEIVVWWPEDGAS